MAQYKAKISEIREKATAAMEDVPDTLIGTILSLTLLTLLGLGMLLFFGFLVTR